MHISAISSPTSRIIHTRWPAEIRHENEMPPSRWPGHRPNIVTKLAVQKKMLVARVAHTFFRINNNKNVIGGGGGMPELPIPQKSYAGTAGFHNYFPHRTDKPTQNGQPEPDQNGRKNRLGAGRALAGGRPSNATKRAVQKKVAVARVSCTFFRTAPKNNHLEDLCNGGMVPIPINFAESDGVTPIN